jgi:hypothetical protein
VADGRLRRRGEELAVAHAHRERLGAVQAAGLDLYFFTGE